LIMGHSWDDGFLDENGNWDEAFFLEMGGAMLVTTAVFGGGNYVRMRRQINKRK